MVCAERRDEPRTRRQRLATHPNCPPIYQRPYPLSTLFAGFLWIARLRDKFAISLYYCFNFPAFRERSNPPPHLPSCDKPLDNSQEILLEISAPPKECLLQSTTDMSCIFWWLEFRWNFVWNKLFTLHVYNLKALLKDDMPSNGLNFKGQHAPGCVLTYRYFICVVRREGQDLLWIYRTQ